MTHEFAHCIVAVHMNNVYLENIHTYNFESAYRTYLYELGYIMILMSK